MIRRLFFTLAAVLVFTVPASAQWSYVSFEQITVSTTSVGFTASKIRADGKPQATQAFCSAEGADLRWTVDGTTPTSSVGALLTNGSTLPTINGHDNLTRFRAIRDAGTDVTMNCFYFGGGRFDEPLTASGGGSGGSAAGGGTTTDADDASIAGGQTNDNVNSLNMAYDGSVWRRLTFYANDATAAGTTFLPTLPGLVETSAPTRTNGRMAGLSFTAGGAARVMIADAAGAALSIATDATFGTSTYTEATTTGPPVGAVRTDTPAALVNTTNEIGPLATSALGGLYTASASDPCSTKAKTYYVVNLAAAATVEIANAVASQFFYICSVNLVTAGASAVLIAEDDTDGCGSLSAGLNGGTTAATGWTFAANGGIALGNGLGTVLKTVTANRYLCIAPSGTGQLSGSISYVSAP